MEMGYHLAESAEYMGEIDMCSRKILFTPNGLFFFAAFGLLVLVSGAQFGRAQMVSPAEIQQIHREVESLERGQERLRDQLYEHRDQQGHGSVIDRLEKVEMMSFQNHTTIATMTGLTMAGTVLLLILNIATALGWRIRLNPRSASAKE